MGLILLSYAGCSYNKENKKYKILYQETETYISVQSIDICAIYPGALCFLHGTFSLPTAVKGMSPFFFRSCSPIQF
jgi:hypothetical protein